MQWIDALGYEEVMTFLRSTPANLFFKDTECRYLFISDVRTFFPLRRRAGRGCAGQDRSGDLEQRGTGPLLL